MASGDAAVIALERRARGAERRSEKPGGEAAARMAQQTASAEAQSVRRGCAGRRKGDCSIPRRSTSWPSLLQHFSDWYLVGLESGRILAHRRAHGAREHARPHPERNHHPSGGLSCPHARGAFTRPAWCLPAPAGSWVGACADVLGCPLARPPVGHALRALRRAGGRRKSSWPSAGRAHYGWAGVFFSRLLPVIRHLIGIPGRHAATGFSLVFAPRRSPGSLLWCSVLAWLGAAVGDHPELLRGSLHRFLLLVLALAALLGALYYLFVHRRPRAARRERLAQAAPAREGGLRSEAWRKLRRSPH